MGEAMTHLRAGHTAREKQLQIGVSHVERAHLNREAAQHFEKAHEKAKAEGDKTTEGIAKSYAESAHKAARDSFREAAKKTSYLEKRGAERDAKVAELKTLAKEHDVKVKEAKSGAKSESGLKKWAEKRASGGRKTDDPRSTFGRVLPSATTAQKERAEGSFSASKVAAHDKAQAATREASMKTIGAESHKQGDRDSHDRNVRAAEAHEAAAKAHRERGPAGEEKAKGHEKRAAQHRDEAKSVKAYLEGSGQWDEEKHPRDETGKFT